MRFVEVTVNGPKTWSLAAALDPQIAEAYDAALDRAGSEIVGWLASHATTRVGPRGRQVQVPVEEIEATVIRHFTSRASDPHRHLHLQINARVYARGGWRGIHTVGVRDSLEAINGIGHAAVMTDPEFRTTLAAHGFTLDADSSEIVELRSYAGAFSARARQIETNIAAYEAAWRKDHPRQEPGPPLRRSWDRRAWAEARPDKVVPMSGEDLRRRWVEELHELGFRTPSREAPASPLRPGSLDRDAVVELALTRLGSRRSSWNPADVRGEVEQIIAATGSVLAGVVRRELAEDLTARAIAASRPLLERVDAPEHVRALTSNDVLAIESDLATRFIRRGHIGTIAIVEGAAGAGKTTQLAKTRAEWEAAGRRMLVVTPTRKAAQVAAAEVGASAHSVAWLLHQHGYRWDTDGRWTYEPSTPAYDARFQAGDLLVVDEAGMLDQDTARALLTLADHGDAAIMLVGDRHQLPAVGRGGVLDLAIRYAPDRVSELDHVRRFTDPAYAILSLQMRRGERTGQVFDELVRRGEVVVHASEVERELALAITASQGELVVADTREQVGKINDLAHRLKRVPDAVVTASGERIGIGDTIATRRNDRDADVANREMWTVVACSGGALTVRGDPGERVLPTEYVRWHVELAYATTAYSAQGSTVPGAHVLVGQHTGAASAYVGMTRGRDHNVAHLVADSIEDARRQWIEVFGRDRADLGPTHAGLLAADAIERYGSAVPTEALEPYSAPRHPRAVPVTSPPRHGISR